MQINKTPKLKPNDNRLPTIPSIHQPGRQNNAIAPNKSSIRPS